MTRGRGRRETDSPDLRSGALDIFPAPRVSFGAFLTVSDPPTGRFQPRGSNPIIFCRLRTPSILTVTWLPLGAGPPTSTCSAVQLCRWFLFVHSSPVPEKGPGAYCGRYFFRDSSPLILDGGYPVSPISIFVASLVALILNSSLTVSFCAYLSIRSPIFENKHTHHQKNSEPGSVPLSFS